MATLKQLAVGPAPKTSPSGRHPASILAPGHDAGAAPDASTATVA